MTNKKNQMRQKQNLQRKNPIKNHPKTQPNTTPTKSAKKKSTKTPKKSAKKSITKKTTRNHTTSMQLEIDEVRRGTVNAEEQEKYFEELEEKEGGMLGKLKK